MASTVSMNPIIKDLLRLYDGVNIQYEEGTFRIKGKLCYVQETLWVNTYGEALKKVF